MSKDPNYYESHALCSLKIMMIIILRAKKKENIGAFKNPFKGEFSFGEPLRRIQVPGLCKQWSMIILIISLENSY